MKKLIFVILLLLLFVTPAISAWTYSCPFDVNVNAGRGVTKAYLPWCEPQGIYDPCTAHNVIVSSLPLWVTVNIINKITPVDANVTYGFNIYGTDRIWYQPDANCLMSPVKIEPTTAIFGMAELVFDTNDPNHLGTWNGLSSDTCRGITHSSGIRLVIKPEPATDISGPFICPVQYGRR